MIEPEITIVVNHKLPPGRFYLLSKRDAPVEYDMDLEYQPDPSGVTVVAKFLCRWPWEGDSP